MSTKETRPSFPFYGREWYSSKRVRVLTPVQRLIYLALLWTEWESNGVADDETELDLIAASEGGTLEDVRRVLRLCFVLADGRWHNAKLETIRTELNAYRVEQARAGREGAEKRWRGHGKPMATDGDPIGKHGDGVAIDSSVSASSSSSASSSASAPEKNPQTPSGSAPPGERQAEPQAKQEPQTPKSRRPRAVPADVAALLAEPTNADLAPCADAIREWAEHKRSKFTEVVARNVFAQARDWGPARFRAAVRHSAASAQIGLFEPPAPRLSFGQRGPAPGAPTDDAVSYARKQAASNSPSLQAEGREKLQRWGLLAPTPVNGTAVHA